MQNRSSQHPRWVRKGVYTRILEIALLVLIHWCSQIAMFSTRSHLWKASELTLPLPRSSCSDCSEVVAEQTIHAASENLQWCPQKIRNRNVWSDEKKWYARHRERNNAFFQEEEYLVIGWWTNQRTSSARVLTGALMKNRREMIVQCRHVNHRKTEDSENGWKMSLSWFFNFAVIHFLQNQISHFLAIFSNQHTTERASQRSISRFGSALWSFVDFDSDVRYLRTDNKQEFILPYLWSAQPLFCPLLPWIPRFRSPGAEYLWTAPVTERQVLR